MVGGVSRVQTRHKINLNLMIFYVYDSKYVGRLIL